VTVYKSVGPVHPDYEVLLRRVGDRAAQTEMVVAEAGGRLVGAVALVPEPNEQSSIAQGNEAEVRGLVVAPEAQGQGVGAALLEWCIEGARARGRDRLVLLTMPWMAAAQRLYERRGFRRTPERDWTPRPGFDCRAYVLDL
jgi:ribosomal protein S18 acetylase RimI-like enzyme